MPRSGVSPTARRVPAGRVKNNTDEEMSVFVFVGWQKICTEVRTLGQELLPPELTSFCAILNSCYRSRLRRAGVSAGVKRDVIKLPSGFPKRWNKVNRKRSMREEKREGEEKEKGEKDKNYQSMH